MVDRALAVALSAWALLGMLPVGVWTGVSGEAYYGAAWGLWVRGLAVVLLVTVLVLVLGGERAAAALRRTYGRLLGMRTGRYLLAIGVVAALEAGLVAWWSFGRMPPLIDGWVQYFQARLLLAGEWMAPPPASPAHFGILFAPTTDRGWFGQYPPIHPALLALGMAVGAPWLVTPLLAAALPAAVYALARHTNDERVARLAAALTVLSPFVMAIDASAMNHLPAALLVTLGLASLPAVAAGRCARAALLGGAVGLLLGLRPLDGVVLAAVAAAPVLAGLRGPGRVAFASSLALAGLAALAPTLAANAATTGHALTYAYTAVSGSLIGLNQSVPWGRVLTETRGLGLTAVDAHQLNVYLLEWSFPVTVLAAIGCWSVGRGARASAAYLLLLVGVLFFYFHRDVLYGPRLLFSAVPALLVLVAAGVVALVDLERPVYCTALAPGRPTLALGDVALVAISVTALLAATTTAPRRVATNRTAGSPVALHPEEDARAAGIDHALVLIPDGLGSRLIVRLWAAGVPMTRTTSIYNRSDACRLTDVLDAVPAGPNFETRLDAALAGATPGRRIPGVSPDPLLRLPDQGPPSARCAAELARDRRGMLQFAPYLYLNTPTLDGPIVWARELGEEEDARLARAYPDRAVYRYRGPRRDGDGPAFEPLSYTPK